MEQENKMPIFFPPHLLQEKMISKEIIHKNNIQNNHFRSKIKRQSIFSMNFKR